MKLQPDPKSSLNTVTRYESDHIEVNAVRYESSVIVMPEGAVDAWPVKAFKELTPQDFEKIASKKPELVIFGSGKNLQFPKPELVKPLIEAKIGFETMNTHAACRTYNILMGEGRNVLAALILEAE